MKVAILALLEAKPGQEEEVAKFLAGALPLAVGEPGTKTWYAFRNGPTSFGIFDTFDDDGGRDAHLSGPIASALMANASRLLAQPPDIRKIDLLANK